MFVLMPMVALLIVLCGLAIGSFLNVVILRHEVGKVLGGRSGCPHCGHVLRWFELVPVVSYLAQRGKCRACAARLSPQYPLVELLTAVTFLLVYRAQAITVWEWWMPIVLVLHGALWAILIVIVVYDLRTKLIPDRFNLIFALLAACVALFETVRVAGVFVGLDLAHLMQFSMHVLAGILLYAPFYGLWYVSHGRWIGLGDGKLAVGIGLLLGINGGISAVMFGFWLGAAVMLSWILVQRLLAFFGRGPQEHLGLRSAIPFGPFLVLGVAVVYFTDITFLSLFWY